MGAFLAKKYKDKNISIFSQISTLELCSAEIKCSYINEEQFIVW